MPKVVRVGHPGAVYCGRPGKWGNPFPMRSEADREAVCLQHARWFMDQPQLIADAKQELRGRDLACYCAPRQCHCDLLLKVANS